MLEILSAAKLDRLDAAPAGLLGQVETLGLAPARERVVEQDRLARPLSGRQLRVRLERLPGRREGNENAATTSASSSTRASTIDEHDRTGENSAAAASPAIRAAPRRQIPSHAQQPARITQASTASPLGKWAIAVIDREPDRHEQAAAGPPRTIAADGHLHALLSRIPPVVRTASTARILGRCHGPFIT